MNNSSSSNYQLST